MGAATPEEPLAPEVSTPFPPLPPEPGGSGEVLAVGLEESQAAPKEEPGPRPRINLRGIMRSISLLEPPAELESASGAGELPEVRLGPGGCPGEGHTVGGWRKTRTAVSAPSRGTWAWPPVPGQLPPVPSEQLRRPSEGRRVVLFVGAGEQP